MGNTENYLCRKIYDHEFYAGTYNKYTELSKYNIEGNV